MRDRPSVVVFDIGNVLIEWDPRHVYRPLFGEEAELMERFLEEVCASDWNRMMDRGLPWSEGIRILTERFPECAELIRAYREDWLKMIPGPVDGTPEILDELLENGVPVHALTNFSSETLDLARARFPFLTRFERVVVSAEEGLLKPEPEIYRLLAERAGFTPSDVVFIDDMRENCAAAERLGWRSHRFTGAGGLRRELADWGLVGKNRPSERRFFGSRPS